MIRSAFFDTMVKIIMVTYTLKNELIRPGRQIDFAKELNPEQLEVVLNGDGPCLVLAGAGSGKTRTLVYRVVNLISRGVRPQEIMLVTFTNKAAKEMLERINLALGADAVGLWGGTFHHIGNRLLRMYGERINIKSDFTILDSEDSLSLIKNCVNSAGAPSDKYFPKARVIHSIISLSTNLCRGVKETIADRYDYLKPEYVPFIERIAESYRGRKIAINALDFDDLLLKWKELLETDHELRARLGEKFKYILVDEYQDTNYLQSKIISLLAAPQNNVLVVGDDSQSIYGFRGADVNNILNFPEVFGGPAGASGSDARKVKIFRLDINYRSTPEILALANYSINKNENKFEKNLQAIKPAGDLPAVAALTDNYQQADFVCQRVLDLQRENGWPLSEIAVLFRSHFQCLELEMELNKRNIPYQMRGGMRFFEQAHLKDVLAFLKIVANAKDEVSWLRILSMQGGIGEATADKIWQQIYPLSGLSEVLNLEIKLGAKAAVGWTSLKRILLQLEKIGRSDLPKMVEAVLRYGYEDYLKSTFENYQERLEDLNQLIAFVSTYDDLQRFLTDTALSENFRAEATGPDAENGAADQSDQLILSTIHQAKGLEWKAVFVIGLADGLFPHAKTYDRPQELSEERRLFYVASTRAREALYLTYPLFSQDNILRPSPFIRELPADMYERWDIEDGGAYNQEEEKVIFYDDDGEIRDANDDSNRISGAKAKGRLMDFDWHL